jgi:hypothetical protein
VNDHCLGALAFQLLTATVITATIAPRATFAILAIVYAMTGAIAFLQLIARRRLLIAAPASPSDGSPPSFEHGPGPGKVHGARSRSKSVRFGGIRRLQQSDTRTLKSPRHLPASEVSDHDAVRLAAISAALLPVPNAPVLRQLNGFGSALYGHFVEPSLQPAFFARLYLTALWLPVVPLGIYLVSHPRAPTGVLLTNVYRFHRRMPAAEFHRLFGHRVLGFYLGALFQAIMMLVGALFVLWLAWIIHQGFESVVPPRGGRAVLRGVGDALVGV